MEIKKLMKSTKLSTNIEIKKWNNSISFLDSSTIREQELTLDVSEKYKFDFIGLLDYLNVPRYLMYPMLIINNFKTWTDYDGEETIKMIDNIYLENFYKDNIKTK